MAGMPMRLGIEGIRVGRVAKRSADRQLADLPLYGVSIEGVEYFLS